MTAPNPIPEDFSAQENMVVIKILPISGNISYDQTGLFPVTSIRGGKYIMFMLDYNSDAILSGPLTSRAETELLRAVKNMYEHLRERGLKPCLNMLDNE